MYKICLYIKFLLNAMFVMIAYPFHVIGVVFIKIAEGWVDIGECCLRAKFVCNADKERK